MSGHIIAPFSFINTLTEMHIVEKQVAQLSLAKPRDALPHDKRQNFKTVT